MLAFHTPVSKSHLVNDNLSARILVLRMFFLLDDADEEIAQQKGTPTSPGTASPYRDTKYSYFCQLSKRNAYEPN